MRPSISQSAHETIRHGIRLFWRAKDDLIRAQRVRKDLRAVENQLHRRSHESAVFRTRRLSLHGVDDEDKMLVRLR
jgi:hypothetical protein